MVWQLLQVRMLKDRPLIFVGPMWRGLRTFIKDEIIARGLASPPDLDVAVWVDNVEQALAVVQQRARRVPPPAQGDPPAGHRGTAGRAGPLSRGPEGTLD